MNRRKSREQAFIFLFESTFGFQDAKKIIENAGIAREEAISNFARNLFENTLANLEQIDKCIEENLMGWDKQRLSKTALSVLRMAVYEMIFESDIPSSVTINEAVEIAKKYSTKDESSYINGVLGAVNKTLSK